MTPDLVSLGLSFAAGTLSILSPCVLPLLPVIFSSAIAENRMAPLALAMGLALSFASAGIIVTQAGQALVPDSEDLHHISALLLILFGATLSFSRLQMLFTRSTAVLGNVGQSWAASLNPTGIHGQFLLGLLLGFA